ncbi:MAG: type III pantothenate kinase [Bacteroidales bacterium]
MNLVIDQGNTFAKIGIFDNDIVIHVQQYSAIETALLENLVSQFSIDCAILSTVKDIDPEILCFLRTHIQYFIELNHETALPFRIAYKTPHTLGRDRIAAVAGVFENNKGKNCLVIDAGTAITYDFIDSDGIYHGGNISPGIEMRFRALHQFTGKLPKIEPEGDLPVLGYNTETAIRSGVMQGVFYEVNGYIHELQGKYPDLLVFLTGGSIKYFEDRVKSTIFADNNIVLKGLNCIINYNAKL